MPAEQEETSRAPATPTAPPTPPVLPVLIVPGIVCSALRVEESRVCPAWEGKRVFAPSVSKVAVSAMKRQSTWHETETGRLQNELLQHFVLKTPSEEVDGIRVRAIEGLSGLNLFDSSADAEASLTATGFSHGNLYTGVINVLKAAGYTEGKDLEAAAYDWRMAPGVLQSRDNFFGRMREKIERMNRESRERKGVVILGHSMGNKAVQYFLNYVMASPGGRAWLDANVYSWVVVGAPFLGAAYTGRMVVSGDIPYPGIDSVFSKHELVILFRSLSSLPWLFPVGAHAKQIYYLRREGALEVKVLRANVAGYGLLASNQVKLTVEVSWGRGRGTASVNSTQSESFDGSVATFHEDDNVMRLGGPPDLPSDAQITITVCEKGLEDGRTLLEPQRSVLCWLCCAPCVLCQIFCVLLLRALRLTGHARRTLLSRLTSKENSGVPRVVSDTMRFSGRLKEGEFVPMRVPLRRWWSNTRGQGDVSIEVRWRSARDLRAEWLGSQELAPQNYSRGHMLLGTLENHLRGFAGYEPLQANGEEMPIRHGTRPYTEVYDKVTRAQMLRMLDCEHVLETWEQYYKRDPLYNDGGVDDTPPVKRVVAISGCDVRTEIGCVLRLNTHRVSNKLNVRTRFVPDDEAELVPGSHSFGSCSMSAGVLFEEPGAGSHSGDGTVPFCSLHHSSTWAGKVDYKEHLLPKSSHSMNLFDARFHDLLLEALALSPSNGRTRSPANWRPGHYTSESSLPR